MAKSKAFSCFIELDSDIDVCTEILCERIHREINYLGMVIIVFEVGTHESVVETLQQSILDFVGSITSDKFEVGVIKSMTCVEYLTRQKRHGIPTVRVLQLKV